MREKGRGFPGGGGMGKCEHKKKSSSITRVWGDQQVAGERKRGEFELAGKKPRKDRYIPHEALQTLKATAAKKGEAAKGGEGLRGFENSKDEPLKRNKEK